MQKWMRDEEAMLQGQQGSRQNRIKTGHKEEFLKPTKSVYKMVGFLSPSLQKQSAADF